MPHYTIEKKIGSGTYGTVIGAKCKISKVQVAIKHIKDFSLYDYDCCKVIREI
jgi:serine/threonine protein kinase